MQRMPMGSAVVSSVWIIRLTIPCRPAAEDTSLGRETMPNSERIAPAIALTTDGPCMEMAIRPATRTSAPLISVLLATWPFLRASLLRLPVGFSVLSSLAMALDEVQDSEHGVGDLVAHERPEEGERGGDDEHGHAHLHGEADPEDVHLGDDLSDHAEGDVGDQQRQDDRSADLDGGDEDGGEGLLDAGGEAGDLRRLGQRDQIEGLLQPAQ